MSCCGSDCMGVRDTALARAQPGGASRTLPGRESGGRDGSFARDDDNVYWQGDRSWRDTESWTERNGQSDRLQEHRRRRSSCRRATLAFQQPGKPHNIGLLKFGLGNADTCIRSERSHYALLSVEPDAAVREGQARQRSHLHLPSIRRPIDRDAEAEDDAFRTALSVSAYGDSGDN